MEEWIYNPNMPYDKMWQYFWEHIGKYSNSHFADITTYAGALAACVIMFFVKKHIKNKYVNICLVSLLSLFIYGICSVYSEPLRLNSLWTLVAFLAPMSLLTIIGLLRGDYKKRLIVYGTALLVVVYNLIYCSLNEDHHKMCYAIKLFVIVFGLIGFAKNIDDFVNTIRAKKKNDGQSDK